MYCGPVPKVSQQYRDSRREHILAAARRCFLRDGFHETSMQDLFAESGLSAGAVYRYFASKDEMILAIAEENMRDIVALLRALATSPHQDGLGASLAEVLDVVRDKHAESQFGAIALIVWAETLRNASLAKRFDVALSRMRADVAEVIREHQKRGDLSADAQPDALAGLVMAIVPGFIQQLTMFGTGAVEGVSDTVRTFWHG